MLLPVSDGYTNVTITATHVLLPHLPELISPQQHHLITHDGARTHRTLAALEVIAQRSSPVQQQSYVELRELLATLSSEETTSSEFVWVYVLIILSLILSMTALTFQCWPRFCVTPTRIPERLPIELPSSTVLEMQSRSEAHADPVTTGCPCRTSESGTPAREMTSPSAVPLQMGARTETNSEIQPRPRGRECFAAPGKFQLRNE
jgi:hypothetical protein